MDLLCPHSPAPRSKAKKIPENGTVAEHLLGTWNSTVYDVTEDWLPILDEVESIPGLFVASGFSGSGFHLGPWVGRTMADYIATASRPEELEPFAERRFREGRLTRGVYPFAR